MALQHPEVDPEMVEKIVCKLKSQGIFDQFRKDCLADVDSRPAYQNLRDKVNGVVANFLSKQTWCDDLNKNQIRESLRQHVQQSFLDIGVNKIVEQVVNPRIFTVFMPKVEDVVYEVLGVDKPTNSEDRGHNRLRFLLSQIPPPPQKAPSPIPMMPNDLDPVSPVSLNETHESSILNDSSSKINEENFNSKEKDKDSSFDQPSETQLSGISDLSSHGSTKLDISESAHLPEGKPTVAEETKEPAAPKTPPILNEHNDLSGNAPNNGPFDFDNFSNLKEKLKKTDPLNKPTDNKEEQSEFLTEDSVKEEPSESSNHFDSKNDMLLNDTPSDDTNYMFDSKNVSKCENARDLSPKSIDLVQDKSEINKSPGQFNPFSEDSRGSSISNKLNIEKYVPLNESSRNSLIVDTNDAESVSKHSQQSVSKPDFQNSENVINDSLKEDSQLSAISNSSKTPAINTDIKSNEGNYSMDKFDISSRDSVKSGEFVVDKKVESSSDKKSSSHRSSGSHHSSRKHESKSSKSSSSKDKKHSSRESSQKGSKSDDKDKNRSDKKESSSSSNSSKRKESDSRHKDSKEKDSRNKSSDSKSKDKHRSESKYKNDKKEDDDKDKKSHTHRESHKHSSESRKEDKLKSKEDKHDKKSDSKSKKEKDGKEDQHKKEKSKSTKSKEEKEKESRKRKREKCGEDSKKKENRRSKDRDDGHGGSGSKERKEERHHKSSSEKTSTVITEEKTSDDKIVSESQMVKLENELDSTLDSESPSDIDLILMRINSSIQEGERMELTTEIKKKPKIANNIFEVKRIIQERKSFEHLDKQSEDDTESEIHEDSSRDEAITEDNVDSCKMETCTEEKESIEEALYNLHNSDTITDTNETTALEVHELSETKKTIPPQTNKDDDSQDFIGFDENEVSLVSQSLIKLNSYIFDKYRLPSARSSLLHAENGLFGKTDNNLNSLSLSETTKSYLSCLSHCNLKICQTGQTSSNLNFEDRNEKISSLFQNINNDNDTLPSTAQKNNFSVFKSTSKQIKFGKREGNTLKDKMDNFVCDQKLFEDKLKTEENNILSDQDSSKRPNILTEEILDNLMKENIVCRRDGYIESESDTDLAEVSSSQPRENNIHPQRRCPSSSDKSKGKSMRNIQRVTQNQRYDSSELYKPRPLFPSTSRRNRLANTDLSIACGKRSSSTVPEYTQDSKKPR